MLKAEEIEKNINSYQQIPKSLQDELRIGKCRNIVAMIEKMNIVLYNI